MEKQLERFFGEMERILVELDTVRSQLVSVSASTESAQQKELAADVRALRERVGRERGGDGGGVRGVKPEEMIRELARPARRGLDRAASRGLARRAQGLAGGAGPRLQPRRARCCGGRRTARRSARRRGADRPPVRGPKAALRPIYERVAEVIAGFEDVEVGPRGTYVSFGRPKQFALVQPSTRTRVDVGLRLPDAPATERLARRGLVRLGEHHAPRRAWRGRGRRRRARGLAARRLRRARLTVDPLPATIVARTRSPSSTTRSAS